MERNRGIGKDGNAALTKGRIGTLGGRPARSFGFQPGGISKTAGKRGATPDYIAREGDYERKNADLVTVGGRDRTEMDALIAECHEGTIRKDGKVALTPILELPHELDVGGWQVICQAAEAWFEARGHACMWAIHESAKKQGRDTDPDLGLVSNPHAHFVVIARPLIDGRVARGGGGQGKPAEAPTLWGKHTWTLPTEAPHPDSFRACKEHIAQVATNELRGAGIDMTMYAGKMRDLGIERKPEKRVPAGAWFAGKRHTDPEVVAAVRARHQAERDERYSQRINREIAREDKAVRVALGTGLVVESSELDSARAQQQQTANENARLKQELHVARQRTVDDEPATTRQINYFFDLLERKNMQIEEDVPWTKGSVGSWIRHLEKLPDVPRQTLETAQTTIQHLETEIRNSYDTIANIRESLARVDLLRDPGTGAVPPEIHQELSRRGLTTLRRAEAREKRAKTEGWESGYQEAEKRLQTPPEARREAPQPSVPQTTAQTQNRPQAAPTGPGVEVRIESFVPPNERRNVVRGFSDEKLKASYELTLAAWKKEGGLTLKLGFAALTVEMRSRGLIEPAPVQTTAPTRDRGGREF